MWSGQTSTTHDADLATCELERADALLTAIDQAVVALDADGTVRYANPAADRLFGNVAGALVGARFTAHVEIDHRPGVDAAIRRARAGYPVRRHECGVGTIGACTWIELDISPLRDGCCVVLARDLRQHHAVRKQASEQHEYLPGSLASVLDTIPVGIVIADSSGAPRLSNRAAWDLLGLHALTPLHQWFATGALRRTDGSPARAEDIPATQTLADGIARRDVELHVVRPWGEAVPVLFNTDAVLDEEGRVVEVCCTLSNIHARRHIERQLQQAQKMESVGTLASGIAHDFNNILCAITGYSELALLRQGLDPKCRDLLGEIQKASDRAANLTRRLLSFSRMDRPAPRAMRLNTAVREMEAILRRLIGRDVELSLTLDDGIPHIQADPAQIEQVLLNLAVNARDAMPAGGPLEIRTECVTLPDEERRHTVSAPAGAYAVLSVRDEGAGMDPDTLAHVFEPFYTTKAPGRGTGLGLSTVYAIVKQSRGAVDVISRVGEGTTFRIYLPLAKAEVIPDRTPTQDGDGPARRPETVLLVEDEPLVRSLIREILEEAGYEIMEAGNGHEALERVQRLAQPPELLVTDMIMPRMGGQELAERMRSEYPALKVLFVSGYVNAADIERKEGLTAFLPKPFDALTLGTTVRDLLDRVPA